MRSTVPAIGLIFVCALPAAQLRWQGDSQIDSEDLIWSNGASLEASDLSTSFGEFSFLGKYTAHGIKENGFGLTPFHTRFYGIRSHYGIAIGNYHFKIGAGSNDVPDWKDYYSNGELSARWTLGPGTQLRGKVHITSEIGRDNPLTSVLSIRTRKIGMDWGLQAGPWTLETAISENAYSGADSASVHNALASEQSVEKVAENRIWKAHAYFYRPIWNNLYAGAFANYADSRHDFYRTTLRTSQVTASYMYFPYDTPVESLAFGAILSTFVDFNSMSLPLGVVTLRLTIPVYSQRRQFWEVIAPPYAGNGYYTFEGSEPLLSGIGWKKKVTENVGLEVDYHFFLKPYHSYGFFRSESYRMHHVQIAAVHTF